jgi:hypothetical protein
MANNARSTDYRQPSELLQKEKEPGAWSLIGQTSRSSSVNLVESWTARPGVLRRDGGQQFVSRARWCLLEHSEWPSHERV